jgi:tape measure domain-containing protein
VPDREVGRLVARAHLITSEYEAGLRHMQTATGQASRQVTTSFAGIGASLRNLGLGIGIAAAVRETYSLITTVDRARLTMARFVGSGSGVRGMERDVRSLANAIGTDYVRSLQSANSLLAAGFDPRRITSAITTINDVAGGSPEKFQRISDALSQMLKKGKVSAEELIQQLGEIAPASQYLARYLGVSQAEALRMVQRGEVTGQTGVTAFLQGAQRQFGGISAQYAQSFGGQVQILSNHLRQLAETMGRAVVPAITTIVKSFDGLLNLLNRLNPTLLATAVQVGAGLYLWRQVGPSVMAGVRHIRNIAASRGENPVLYTAIDPQGELYEDDFARIPAADLARTRGRGLGYNFYEASQQLRAAGEVRGGMRGALQAAGGSAGMFLAANAYAIALTAATAIIVGTINANKAKIAEIRADFEDMTQTRAQRGDLRRSINEVLAVNPNDPRYLALSDAARRRLIDQNGPVPLRRREVEVMRPDRERSWWDKLWGLNITKRTAIQEPDLNVNIQDRQVPGLNQSYREAVKAAREWEAARQGLKRSSDLQLTFAEELALVSQYRDAMDAAAKEMAKMGGPVSPQNLPGWGKAITGLEDRRRALEAQLANVAPSDVSPRAVALRNDLKEINAILAQRKGLYDELYLRAERVREVERQAVGARVIAAGELSVLTAQKASATARVPRGMSDSERLTASTQARQLNESLYYGGLLLGSQTKRYAELRAVAADTALTEQQRATKVADITSTYDRIETKLRTGLQLAQERLIAEQETAQALVDQRTRANELAAALQQIRQSTADATQAAGLDRDSANAAGRRVRAALNTPYAEVSQQVTETAAQANLADYQRGRAAQRGDLDTTLTRRIAQLREARVADDQLAAAERDRAGQLAQFDRDTARETSRQQEALRETLASLRNEAILREDTRNLTYQQADAQTSVARRADDLQRKLRRANPLAELFGGPWREMAQQQNDWQDARIAAARKEADIRTKLTRDLAQAAQDGKSRPFKQTLVSQAQDALNQIRYELADKGVDVRLNLAKSSLEAITQNLSRYIERSGLFDRSFQQGWQRAVSTMGAMIPQSYGALPTFGQLPAGGKQTIVIQLAPGLEGKMVDQTLQSINTVLQQSQQGLAY